MAEWTYKLDIDMLERKGTSACLMATRAMIARIRELEAELERASQPGSGEDAERMKWLAAQCENGLGLKHVGGADIVQTWFVRFPVIESGVGMTLADAIDAARASLDGPREG